MSAENSVLSRHATMKPVLILDNPRGRENENTFNMSVCVTFVGEEAKVHFVPHIRNRIIKTNRKDFIQVCFRELKFEGDTDGTKAKNYMKSILTEGIQIGGRNFLFCGHSISQLRARSCFMMEAKSHAEVAELVNKFGDFSKIKDVGKRSNRIGLAFTSAKHIVYLNPVNTLSIRDVYVGDKNFTDGCGLITQDFAKVIMGKYIQHYSMKGINPNYPASVFQIRYKGHKGTLVTVTGDIYKRNDLPDINVAFRDSMEKFKNCTSDELYVLDFSKPTGPAHLNGELVSTLSSLGVPDHVFISRLLQYYNYIIYADTDEETAIDFFDHQCRHKILYSLGKTRKNKKCSIKKHIWFPGKVYEAQATELNSLYDKNGMERVHIMVPQSRLLYGVNDNSSKLNEGECFVQYTTNKQSLALEILRGEIVVGRNPCFHPGDIRVFKAVDIPELHHLVDCIVFPTTGELLPPDASQMSGGDLDGDRFFVCWDRELIPPTRAAPFDYHTIAQKPLIPFANKNQQVDLINYFVEWDNKILRKLRSLYFDWIRANERERAFSQQCMEIHTLFSKRLEGEEIEIPEDLLQPPNRRTVNGEDSTFILDTLTTTVSLLLLQWIPSSSECDGWQSNFALRDNNGYQLNGHQI